MITHALIVAALACLAQPSPEALACLNSNPELRAHAEMLAGLAEIAVLPDEKPARCLRFRSCGRR
jgi:hypothetical protein